MTSLLSFTESKDAIFSYFFIFIYNHISYSMCLIISYTWQSLYLTNIKTKNILQLVIHFSIKCNNIILFLILRRRRWQWWRSGGGHSMAQISTIYSPYTHLHFPINFYLSRIFCLGSIKSYIWYNICLC